MSLKKLLINDTSVIILSYYSFYWTALDSWLIKEKSKNINTFDAFTFSLSFLWRECEMEDTWKFEIGWGW